MLSSAVQSSGPPLARRSSMSELTCGSTMRLMPYLAATRRSSLRPKSDASIRAQDGPWQHHAHLAQAVGAARHHWCYSKAHLHEESGMWRKLKTRVLRTASSCSHAEGRTADCVSSHHEKGNRCLEEWARASSEKPTTLPRKICTICLHCEHSHETSGWVWWDRVSSECVRRGGMG